MDPSVKTPAIPTGRLILAHIGRLCTGNEELGDIDDASIVIDGNVIEWVGKACDLPAELEASAKDAAGGGRGIRDCSHIALATAGFINTHHHFFQTLTRGVGSDSELFGWLTTCYGIWKHMTVQQYKAGCKATACELILSGCTLATDHAYMYFNGIRLDDEIAAVMPTGIRFQPVRSAMTVGQSLGGLTPDDCIEKEDFVLKECRRAIETYHDPSKYAMLRIALGPCAPFNVSKDLMLASARMAREYDKVMLHTHLAENKSDIDYSLENFGQRPNEYIASVEWDRDDCWFGHCCMLNDADIDTFAKSQCGVAHCPSSNMRLASGITPIRKLLDKNVPTGLGCDGSASNDCSNILAEARLATLLARIRDFREATDEKGTNAVPGDPGALSPRDVLYIATQGGARCLNRQDEVGQIAPGFAADIIGWCKPQGYSSTALSMVGSCPTDPLGAVLLCAPPRVTMSIINGNVVVWDHELLTVDLKQVIEEADAASKELFAAASVCTPCK